MTKKKKAKKKNKEEQSLKDYVIDRLLRGGFVFPGEPTADQEYLNLPPDITAISNEDLGRHYNALTQQKNWVLTLIASLEVEQAEIEQTYDLLYAKYYENSPYMQVNDKKYYVLTQPKIRYWKKLLTRINATLTMAYRNLETLDNSLTLVSREVTRRIGLYENERRNENIGSYRRKKQD